jgi:DNA-binding FadR family transcriptional regulator
VTNRHSPTKLREAAGRNLHERIANTLGERIVGGIDPPGSALPTEIELCATLSVSRSALREAFKLLAAKRLIVSRQKVGTLVRPRSDWNMLDPEVLAWHLRAAPTDEFVTGLFEVRRIIEPSAAASAAERRTPETLAPIERALADMVRFQDGSGDLTAADLRFHQAILDSTGNHFLASFGAVIESSLVASFQLSWHSGYHTPEYSLRQHQGVMEAIRDGRPTDAYSVMTQLLRSAIEDVRESLIRRKRGEAPAMPAPAAAAQLIQLPPSTL